MTYTPSLRYIMAVLCLPTAAVSPAAAQDAAFRLATGDPARATSPVIGNGRIGLVIPALGFGPGASFHAGLYEHAPGDVPRLAATPALADSHLAAVRLQLTPLEQGWRYDVVVDATGRRIVPRAEGGAR